MSIHVCGTYGDATQGVRLTERSKCMYVSTTFPCRYAMLVGDGATSLNNPNKPYIHIYNNSNSNSNKHGNNEKNDNNVQSLLIMIYVYLSHPIGVKVMTRDKNGAMKVRYGTSTMKERTRWRYSIGWCATLKIACLVDLWARACANFCIHCTHTYIYVYIYLYSTYN